MKKCILSISLLLLFLLVKSQTLHQDISFTFDNAHPVLPGNQIYEARDFIDFLPHSEYVPTTGNSLIARINPDYIPIVDYSQDPMDCDRVINMNLAIGSTTGEFNVSSTGAATYNIPIILPPGTNNLIPQISFIYDSHRESFNGYLGRGWTINGLSEISRSVKTINQDGLVEGINMTFDDRFDLGGKRLVVINGQYGSDGSIYHTEMESFSQITSNGTNGNGPDWFLVETKEGKKIYYGSTADSKVILPGLPGVYKWLISRIEDNQENYIEFKYKNRFNDFYIDEIRYTGNTRTNPLPYNSIKFYYGIRDDKNTLYILGEEVRKELLLTEVKITSESKQSHRYKLDYIDDTQNHKYSSLNQITEYGSENNPLNSTVFTYDNIYTPLTITDETYNVEGNFNSFGCLWDHLPPYPSHLFSQRGGQTQLYIGDFNGDGLDDYLTLNNPLCGTLGVDPIVCPDMGNLYASISVVYSTPGPGVTPDYNCGIYPPAIIDIQGYIIHSIKILDVNGDGKDDVVFQVYNFDASYNASEPQTNGTYRLILLLSTVDPVTGYPILANIDLTSYYGLGDLPFTGTYLKVSDFNGDQKREISIVTNNDYNTSEQTWLIIPYPDPIYSFHTHASLNIQSLSPDYYIGDFNGDNKDELMTFDDQNLSIYEISSFSGASLLYQTSSLNHLLGFIGAIGDFNGDGRSDFLFKNLQGQWLIYYFNNDALASFEISSITSPNKVNWCVDDSYVIDLDGDHKTDLVEITGLDQENMLLKLFYSLGNNNFQTVEKVLPIAEFSDKDYFFHPGDFNGDGAKEISFNKYTLSSSIPQEVAAPIKIIHTPFNQKKAEITCFLDGNNKKTEVEYAPLCFTDNTGQNALLTNSGNYNDYPNFNYNSTKYFVKSAKIPLSNSDQLTQSYKYEDALFNETGRGFLGFLKMTKTNSTGEIITSENELNSEFQVFDIFPALSLKSTKVEKPSGNLLSSKSYIRSFTDLYPHVFLNYLNNVKDTNFLTNNEYSYSYNYSTSDDLKFGNVTSKVTEVNQGQDGTETESYEYMQAGAWCPSKVSKITTTNHRKDEPTLTRKVGYDYYTSGNNIGLLASVTKNPDLTNKLVTNIPTYDEYGNSKQIDITSADIAARSATFEFDSKGRFMTKITNPLSQVTEIQYEKLYGNKTQVKDVNQLVTNFEYDEFGRLKKTTLPQGTSQTIELAWDNNGSHNNALYHQTTLTSGQSPQTVYCDFLGRPVQKNYKGFDSGDIFIDIAYNSLGLTDKISEPHAVSSPAPINWTYYFYNDPLYRCTAITSPSINQSIQYNGSSVVATNNLTQQTVNRIYNPFGEVSEIDEQGNENTINYTYNSFGQVRKINVSGVETNMEYDPDYGFQKSLADPDAGLTQYVYNSLDQLTKQTDHKGVVTILAYDKLGRILSNSNTVDGNINYIYDTEDYGIGKLAQVIGYNGITSSYQYDNFGRLKHQSENVDGYDYPTDFHYNVDDLVDRIAYPSGFAVKQYYNLGYLTSVNRADDNTPIYVNETINAMGQVEQYSYGNNLITKKDFDPVDHIIKDIQVAPGSGGDLLINYNYDHDPNNHFIIGREDVTRNLKETFEYDPVYLRLKKINGINGIPSSTISYENNGNIKTIDEKAFEYGANGGGVHAVSSVANYTATAQDITYTTFNKVNSISEGDNQMSFTYGPDYARKISVWKENNAPVKTKYYLSNFEKIINHRNGVTSELHYINGSDGLAAVYVKNSDNTEKWYYSHKDHLGSIIEMTDETGAKVTQASASFDAWGNRRDPDTWQPYTSTPPPLLFDRGFTGHEHYDMFGIINMNGRCYDPKVGRFLSPDIVNQDPGCSQNYNRYSYCLNNPLNFVDLSGYDYGDEEDYRDEDGYGNPQHSLSTDVGPQAHFDFLFGPGIWGIINLPQLDILDHGNNGLMNNVPFTGFDFSQNNDISMNNIDNSTSNSSDKGYSDEADAGRENETNFDNNEGVFGDNEGDHQEIGDQLFNTANRGLEGAGYLSGGIGAIQVGMLEYRTSLPITSKIGTFASYSSTYRILGATSKGLGAAATYVGAPLSVYSDVKLLESNEIGLGRFTYRQIGLGSSITIGYAIGGPYGAGAGAVVSGGFWAGEIIYDAAISVWNQILQFNSDFNNAASSGTWYPGR